MASDQENQENKKEEETQEEESNTLKVEDKSYSVVFLVTIMVMLLVTVWTIYDEAITRRPWKKVQEEFFKYEHEVTKAEYEEALKAMPEEERELTAKLEEAKKNLEKNEEYKKASQDLRDKEIALEDVTQKYQFAKSELDAAFYLYKHALHRGSDASGEKAEVDKLEKFANSFLPKIDEAQEKRDEALANLDEVEKEIVELTKKIDELKADANKYKFKLEAVARKIPKIEQLVIEDIDMVDRCSSCHLGIDEPEFADVQKFPQPHTAHPNREFLLGNHPIDKFGCVLCHGGQGRAMTYEDALSRDNEYWKDPVAEGFFIESNCKKCHFQVVDLEGAPHFSKGNRLLRELGCHGCHKIEGYEDLEKVGPDLTKLKMKTANPEWLIRWIENPKSYLPHTKMPNFKFSRDEAESVAAYLLNTSEEAELEKVEYSEKMIDDGKKIVEQVGCYGCHFIGERPSDLKRTYLDGDFDYAPDLSRVGDKVDPDWLFAWVKDPSSYNSSTKMPNLRLSDGEAKATTAYLMSTKSQDYGDHILHLNDPQVIEKGRILIQNYGCFGCHNIKGFENAARIGVELTEFSNKEAEALDFGDVTEIDFTWEAWTKNKLKNPRLFATERIVARMPDFELTDDEVEALTVLLKSFRGGNMSPNHARMLTKKEQEIEKGRRLVEKYNCVGCHKIENRGGDIAPIISDFMVAEGKSRDEAVALVPPNLNGEGDKVQAEWLFNFLKNPVPIRPWLNVKMPTFNLSKDEATDIARYFASLADVDFPFEFVDQGEISKDQIKVGKEIFTLLQCKSCHPTKGQTLDLDVGSLAPDLTMAKDRLRHDWIARWLKDPQSIQKGTKMPNNWIGVGRGERRRYIPAAPSMRKIYKEYKKEQVDMQIDALRDYLLTL